MKKRITMRQIYEDVADLLRGSDDLTPTTVRCYCNDVLESYERDGFAVHHGYSQTRAFSAVRRMLGLR